MRNPIPDGLVRRSIQVVIDFNPFNPGLYAITMRYVWRRRYCIYLNAKIGDVRYLEDSILAGLSSIAGSITQASFFKINIGGLPTEALPLVKRIEDCIPRTPDDSSMLRWTESLRQYGHRVDRVWLSKHDCKRRSR